MRIALHGKAGSGKNLVARIIQYHRINDLIDSGELDELYELDKNDLVYPLRLDDLSRIHTLSFATPIKETLAMIAPVTVEELDDKEVKERIWMRRTYREWLQFFGDTIRRDTPRAFIDVLDYKVEENNNYIINDLRFLNELEYCVESGFITIKIERDFLKAEDSHASETELDSYEDWDYVIRNDNDLQNLIDEVYKIYIKV